MGSSSFGGMGVKGALTMRSKRWTFSIECCLLPGSCYSIPGCIRLLILF